jgi:GT2 family glycosyltransferase
MLSIETPVIKAGWLLPCIESVFRQNSSRWQFSLLWDNGDERSRQILEVLQEFRHPRVSVHYGNGLGIARARRFLTEQTTAEYILPLDDDDLLKPDAVERFLDAAEAAPWSGIIRARRDFVDESGGAVEMEDWFPFGPRRYQRGMTCDLYNHGQPYMISRWAYGQTTGWEGFEEYRFAGEDCDIFAKIEEVAEIELLDGVLYSYRLSDSRTSHQLGAPAAEDMWRRLAIATLQRRAIPLSLESDTQPFSFSTAGRPPAQQDDVDLVILANAWPDAENRSHESIERWSSKTAVPRDAIHVLASNHCGSQDIARALVSSNRHYVCLMRGEPGADSADVIAALVRTLQAYDADLIGPKAVDSRGRLLVADPHFTSDLMPATGGPVEADDGRFGYVATVPWLPANLLVVRRHVLRSIPGLDASLAGRLQDADFCLRARRRGFTCLYAGTVTAVCTSFEEEERRVDLTRRFLDRWGRLPHLLFPEEGAPEARF